MVAAGLLHRGKIKQSGRLNCNAGLKPVGRAAPRAGLCRRPPRRAGTLGRSLTLPPERRSPTRPVLKTPENAPDRKAEFRNVHGIGSSVRMRPSALRVTNQCF